MRELLLALPPGREDLGRPWGLVPAHLCYRVEPGLRLAGVGLTGRVRGGAMMIAASGGLEEGDCRPLCRQVEGECRRRGFDRVICDFEGPPTGGLSALAQALGNACAQAGLALYLPEALADLAPECRALVSSRVIRGTLAGRLERSRDRWGADRVVLAVEAGAEDCPLPVQGRGAPLEEAALAGLMARLEPAVCFDRGLCAHYFTYLPRGGRARLVLFDTPHSLRAKLDLAQALGLYGALMAAPEVDGWLEQVFGGGQAP